MAFDRNTFAGMTDYTGATIVDILAHLREWERNTSDAAAKLQSHLARAVSAADRLENPREVIAFCGRFSALFSRYAADFQRLVTELPRGVREGHVKIVRQLYESARHQDDVILRFRGDWVYAGVKDESLRPLLDSIYVDAREVMIDFQDLSNLAPQLETFVGNEGPREAFTDFELMPNFFGIGLNLNRALVRLSYWWRSR